jgi:hypothetical protein
MIFIIDVQFCINAMMKADAVKSGMYLSYIYNFINT